MTRKLTEADVRFIRERASEPARAIANHLKVSVYTVRSVRRGDTHAGVTGEIPLTQSEEQLLEESAQRLLKLQEKLRVSRR